MSSKTCNRCDAPIVWGETTKGKWLALDAVPVANGPWILIPGTTHALEADDPQVERIVASSSPTGLVEHRYRLHATSCGLAGLRPVGESIAKVVRR